MSGKQYPKLNSAQTERLDAIDNAVYTAILAFLDKPKYEFPWDMS